MKTVVAAALLSIAVAAPLQNRDSGARGYPIRAMPLTSLLPLDTKLQHRFDRGLLGGVEVITGKDLVAVPYFAWNNRGKGEMAVWIPY